VIQTVKDSADQSARPRVAVALLVGKVPAGTLDQDLYSRADSAREVLERLKILRYRWLLAGLDVPDMRPWELFGLARRPPNDVRCVLVDRNLTTRDERLARTAGAAVFTCDDPELWAAITRSSAVRAGATRAHAAK
jgi:hypothetical protein